MKPALAVQCDSTPACLKAIEDAQRETRSIAADFRQVKHLTLLDEPLVSRGRFYFAEPERVRLEVEEPERATIVVRGSDVHVPGVGEKEREALAASPMVAMFRQLGAVFTGSVERLEESFEVSAEADGDGVQLTLVPRAAQWKESFQRMRLRFAGRDLVVHEIRIDDALGDRLEITMENVRRNPDLPDDLFAPQD